MSGIKLVASPTQILAALEVYYSCSPRLVHRLTCIHDLFFTPTGGKKTPLNFAPAELRVVR